MLWFNYSIKMLEMLKNGIYFSLTISLNQDKV